MNPPLRIVKKFGLNVIVDDVPGGPKTRLYEAFKEGPNKILYVGNPFGLGIIAVSLIGKKVKKKVVILTTKRSDFTDEAERNGAKLVLERDPDVSKYSKKEWYVTHGLEEEVYNGWFLKAVSKLLPRYTRLWVPDIGVLKGLPRSVVAKEGEFNSLIDHGNMPFWEEVLRKAKPGDWVYSVGDTVLDTKIKGGSTDPRLHAINYKLALRRELEKRFTSPDDERFVDTLMLMHSYFLGKPLNKGVILMTFDDPKVYKTGQKVNLPDNVITQLENLEIKPLNNKLIIKGDSYTFGTDYKGTLNQIVKEMVAVRKWPLKEAVKSVLEHRVLGFRVYFLNVSFYETLLTMGFTHECLMPPYISFFYKRGADLFPVLPDYTLSIPFSQASLVGTKSFINNSQSLVIQRDVYRKAYAEIIKAMEKDVPTCIVWVTINEELPKVDPILSDVFKTTIIDKTVWCNPFNMYHFYASESCRLCILDYKCGMDWDTIVKAMSPPLDSPTLDDSLGIEYAIFLKSMKLRDTIVLGTWVPRETIIYVLRPFLYFLKSSNSRMFEVTSEKVLELLILKLADVGVNISLSEYNSIKSLFTGIDTNSPTPKISYVKSSLYIGPHEIYIGETIPLTNDNVNDVVRCALGYGSFFHQHLNVPDYIFDHYAKGISLEGCASPFNHHSSRYPKMGYCSLLTSDIALGSRGLFYPSEPAFMFRDELDNDLIDTIRASYQPLYFCTSRRIDDPLVIKLLVLPNIKSYRLFSNGLLTFGNRVSIKTPVLMAHFNQDHSYPEWKNY